MSMRRSWVSALLFVAPAFLAVAFLEAACSPASAQSMSVGVRLHSEEMLRRNGLTRAWWGQAVTNSSRDKLIHITLDESNLYTQSSSGIITAFDNESGRRLWATRVGGSDRAIYPASSNDDLLLVVNGMSLYAVQKVDGAIRWDLKMPGMPASSPVADQHRIYLGFLDGSLYTFDIKKINEYDREGKLPTWSFQTVMWRYKTSKSIVIPAVPYGPLVAFASKNGSLYSVGAMQRELKFQFETDAALTAPMVRYKKFLLLASEDFNFYEVNIENGRMGWQFSAGLPIRKAPVVVNDEVYLLPERGGMFKLSAKTGVQLWWKSGAEQLVGVSPTKVYATDRTNNLLILSRENRNLLGTIPLERFSEHVTNDRSDRLYVATQGGLVVCLHEMGRDYPVYHLHPEKLPIMPEFAPESPDGEPDAGEKMPADGDKPESETEPGEKPAADMPAEDKPAAEKPAE